MPLDPALNSLGFAKPPSETRVVVAMSGGVASKDQSYFLFSTTPEQLDYHRFPLGHHASKDETRALARKYGLALADKPDSQDICFVPNGNYASVIEKLRPGAAEPGEIVDTDGNVLAQHNGVIHYTIGQRRGLGIGGLADPLYVVKLDVDKKHVIVGPKEMLTTRTVPVRETRSTRRFRGRRRWAPFAIWRRARPGFAQSHGA